jgi:chromate transporter
LFRDVRTWSAYGLSLPVPQPGSVDVPAVVIAAGAMFAMLRLRAPMLPVLSACATAGLLVTWWMR